MPAPDPLQQLLADPAWSAPLRARLAGGGRCGMLLPGVSATAFCAWHLALHHAPVVVLVADGPRTLETLLQDAQSLLPATGARLLPYPGWDTSPGQGVAWNLDLAGDRLRTLTELSAALSEPNGAPALVVTDIQALMQRTSAPGDLRGRMVTLTVGGRADPEKLAETLAANGYDFGTEVLNKGEAVRRGGILDAWPPDSPQPVRVEFFGDEIESLRRFDPETQRSVDRIESITLGPAAEAVESGDAAPASDFLAFLPAGTAWVWLDADAVEQHAALYEKSMQESGAGDLILGREEFNQRQAGVRGGGELRGGDTSEDAPVLDLAGIDGLPGPPQGGQGPDIMDGRRRAFVRNFADMAKRGARVMFWMNTPGTLERFEEGYLRAEGAPPKGLTTRLGALSEGFAAPGAMLWLVGEADVYGLRKATRGRYERKKRESRTEQTGARIQEAGELNPGDLVVHIDHGVGRYLGLQNITFNGRPQEVLTVEYAQQAKLHIPVSQANLLSRYVGLGGGTPELHHIGGRRWEKEKAAAAKAVQDLAAKLLQTQAMRQTQPGIAFAADGHWQHEFEAAFPYHETDDQETVIAAVKADMEKPNPMDRLVCGDVGYGKTEVAMRAAFKAVMSGRQVAMLVPTTILAQQHYESFVERMTSFPVSIGMLSRFRTKGEQDAILKQLATGAIDIVIGTHRVVSPDVVFKDLGLVIIDEEQRFGVAHKERLKEMRQTVDVLTLTATPIPRTLYMSMTGARDMSVIQTAPRERLPVTTVVKPFGESLIRQAILQELNREGQVFFLHNRVGTIRFTEIKLKQLVPEARIITAHGRMNEHELEEAMHRFIQGEADVLLCTTIIESGVDIPNANTIIIDRADRFGLSELYQLRGRVGRSKQRGFCYLLLPEDGFMSGDARKRIRAIQRHSNLGAGFKLAMKDLEIRGAGNLLGSEQSGHITAVGFELYCQLLDRTVRALRNEKAAPIADATVKADFLEVGSAETGDAACAVPATYIEDESQRVDAYRRIAGAATAQEIQRLEAELTDRFGKPPRPLRNLILIARIRIAASEKGIREVEARDGKVMLSRHGQYLMQGHYFPRIEDGTPEKRLKQVLNIVANWKLEPK